MKHTHARRKCWRPMFFSTLLLFCMTLVYAQQVTVTGTVLDDTGVPIIGANVIEKGTTSGTVTDLDGKYTLSVSKAQKAILQYSYIGYNSIEETVKGRKVINVKLASSVVNLGEVVAIGYGTQTRREITGSVTNVSEKDFNKGVTTSATDLLKGKVSGLIITNGSGDVSDNATIRLRGTSTLQKDNGPLIVIDGVPGGDMSTVAPQDIESISVLKDASSAAIYGSRSAGGVILITTKRGSGSKTSINYTGYVATSTVSNKPDMLTADEWRNYAKEMGQDGSVFDQYGADVDTDWFGELMRTGVSHNHNLSLSGGSSNSNYRASVNYMKNDGIVKDNDQDKLNFRFQFSQRAINNRLKIGLTGAATILNNERAAFRNFVLAYNMLPVYPVYTADGEYYDNVQYDQGNPVRNQNENSKGSEFQRFYGNGDISFTIIDGLDLKGTFYKSRGTRNYSEYKTASSEAGRTDAGFAKKENWSWDKNLMEWTANYDKTFNDKHKLNVLAGYSYEDNIHTYFRAQNRNFVNDMLGSDNLQSGQDLRAGDSESSKNMYKLISFYGRAHYSYDEKYMATVTVRRDGSTKFGKNNKWGIFPSGAFAWGISQEKFMQDVKWVNDLKLRAGYGVTGNQDGLDPYTTLELYGENGKYYDNGKWLSAYKIAQNSNPDLKWEETSMLNIGVDFSILKNRLSGTIEWYSKKTSDMLYKYKVPSPPYLYNEMMANVGDMSNKGIEIMLNLDAIRNKTFSWNVSLNLSHNKNEITSLSNDLYSTSRILAGDAWVRGGSGNTTHVIEEGYPVGQFFGWKCEGIDADGKFIFTDITGDGQISEDDRTYLGSAQPKVVLGFNNSFTYRQLDFSFFFRGNLGSKVMNHPRMAYANPGSLIGANAINDPLLYQLKEVPKYSDYYIENGSFIRLDNISLGYTFKTNKIDWLDNARVYVTGQNLFVITAYKGLDPEVPMDGLDPGVERREFYPKARTFSLGVNLSF